MGCWLYWRLEDWLLAVLETGIGGWAPWPSLDAKEVVLDQEGAVFQNRSGPLAGLLALVGSKDAVLNQK